MTYVADRGYTDYNWWFEINSAGAFFVTRLKKDAKIKELTTIQSITPGISSQIFVLTNRHPGGNRINKYANIPLKKVVVEREGKSPLILVTNDFNRSDSEIAELYKQRWQIELFFKWIKQNLKIKKFLGRSENAIKTQICIALISFILLRNYGIMEENGTKTLINYNLNGVLNVKFIMDNTGIKFRVTKRKSSLRPPSRSPLLVLMVLNKLHPTILVLFRCRPRSKL